MRNSKTLLSIAVATALAAVAVQANAAAPTANVYGDLAVAFVYNTAAADTGKGSSSSYGVFDNVSLIGVKGDVATIDGTKYFYDFNWILNLSGGSAATHLSIVGMDGGFGTVTFGKRDNGLFLQMVDGSSYQTNWFYTPGMSSFQVSDAIKYVSKASGGLQFGVQAFDLGKSADAGSKSSTNYTVAGTYAMGDLTFAAGYTSFADIGSASSDQNQFGIGQNTWSGVTLKSTTGISAAYKAGKAGFVAAYDMRKPVDTATDTSTINTLMLTGSYAYTDKTTLVANYSDTSQSGGVKGNVITAMVSYAPVPALFYSLEFQTSDKKANESGITGSTGLTDGTSTGIKGSSAVAVGVTYNF